MALTKLGSIITALSGKVGGQSFGNGRGGTYIKNIGSYPRSVTQAQGRFLASSQSLAQSWRQLSEVNRKSWIDATIDFPYVNRVGDTKYYSGFNLYMKFNGNLIGANLSTVLTPSAKFSFTALDAVQVVYGPGTLSSIANAAQLNVRYSFFFTSPVSPGRKASSLNFYFIRFVTRDEFEAGVNLTASFLNKFGQFTPGSISHWKIKAISTADGQVFKNIDNGFVEF